MVSLKEGQNAYIKYPNASANNLIDVSLRFKTQAQSGIILLTNTRDGSDPFSLFLLNGELVRSLFCLHSTTAKKTFDLATVYIYYNINLHRVKDS